MTGSAAARLGSDTDLAVVDSVFQRMEAAHKKRDPSDEARLDAEFHLAIIEVGPPDEPRPDLVDQARDPDPDVSGAVLVGGLSHQRREKRTQGTRATLAGAINDFVASSGDRFDPSPSDVDPYRRLQWQPALSQDRF